ncbi:unnamed protein product [Meloidogyne enterolobii]|uniref:Uncharacterized protein n=1 Tax=Meloidogyne enterolobii TaxID=390850 RepID=A0ACB0ZMR4_MELEN
MSNKYQKLCFYILFYFLHLNSMITVSAIYYGSGIQNSGMGFDGQYGMSPISSYGLDFSI